MKAIASLTATLVSGAAALMLGISMPAHAADAEAAQALIKKNECSKCHAIDKEKKGPSWKKISAKYKGKADGEEKAIKNMTTGSKVKLDDGTEEEHKIIKEKDPAALKNLAQWILSQ
ncbi:MAG: c-type cytochrome [Burkholderiales bacterium]|nr:c-type cytochrome [Burkholderiales bacterium]